MDTETTSIPGPEPEETTTGSWTSESDYEETSFPTITLVITQPTTVVITEPTLSTSSSSSSTEDSYYESESSIESRKYALAAVFSALPSSMFLRQLADLMLRHDLQYRYKYGHRLSAHERHC